MNRPLPKNLVLHRESESIISIHHTDDGWSFLETLNISEFGELLSVASSQYMHNLFVSPLYDTNEVIKYIESEYEKSVLYKSEIEKTIDDIHNFMNSN